jgi:excinuclease UvrABC nuclease subunit
MDYALIKHLDPRLYIMLRDGDLWKSGKITDDEYYDRIMVMTALRKKGSE